MRMPTDERMQAHEPIALRYSCPYEGAAGYSSDGFLGAWSPTRALHVSGDIESSSRAAHLQGPNWFMSSSVALLPSGQRPNIHGDQRHDRALAFRGYVVEPPLHQYSAPVDLWSFWQHGGGRYPNGVFATALIEGAANRLTLRTDAFGFSPLYFRVHGDLVLFGTKPDFLVTANCEIDPLGAATVMAHSYPLGDRTLLHGIARCPYGVTLHFEGSTESRRETWFAGGDLPEADQPFDEAAIARVERVFQQAVARCTALDHGETHVPLSSGYDSRRIVGALLQQDVHFRATTVRVFRNGGRDLDARHAAEIAAHYRIEHNIVDLPEPEGYSQDDAVRRHELCAETAMHDGWVVSLMRALPDGPATIIDGFLGDVLANPGYRLAGADFFHDAEGDIERIAEDLARTPLQRHVAEAFRPGEAAKAELHRYLAPMAGKRNVAEFAYMLLRQRRATVLWSQQLARPGHLMTCPFADLDYIRTVTALRPEDRCAAHVQHACLQRFHPELAAFRGSHSIPLDATPIGQQGNRQRTLACMRRLTEGFAPKRSQHLLNERMTPLGRGVMMATWMAPKAVSRWHWMVRPACEVLLHDHETTPVWIEERSQF